MMKTIQRIPRPLGVTGLIREERLKEATDVILHHWVTNNFTICQQAYNIPQVAKLLHLTVSLVVKNITKPMKNWLGTMKQEESFATILSLVTQFSLTDRSFIQAQVFKMVASQGDEYKPFLSSEVNHSLNTLNTSTKNLIELVKLFKPDPKPNPIQIANLNHPGQAVSEHGKLLGTVEAIRLIEANRSKNLLEPGGLQDAILGHEIKEELPEVVATKQQGLNPDGSSKTPHKRLHNKNPDSNIKDAVIIP